MPIRVLALLALLALLLTGTYLALTWKAQRGLPEGLIQASGRIEGDHILVATKVPGRIQRLLAREGDTVEKGQLLAQLDDKQARARVAEAEKAVAALDAQIAAAQTDLALLRSQVPLDIEAAEAQVEHAKAMLEKAQAAERQAYRDMVRFRALARKGAVDERQKEQAELAWKSAKSGLEAARAALVQAEKRLAQARLGRDRIRAREAEVAALKAQRERAQAALEEARSALDDLFIRAPVQGTLTERLVDEGEVVAAGTPLFDLVDLDRLYLKAYVPEVERGKLRLGLPARIYTDAFPERFFPAVLRYIAKEAEFTPKEVQTFEERVKLVYAIRLYLEENPDHLLTPGLPADAVIRWKPDVPWHRPVR